MMGNNAWNSLITAGVVGLVLAIFRLIQWYWNTRSEQTKREAQAAEFGGMSDTGVRRLGWADTTGEHRPVVSSECVARHALLTEELSRGAQKMANLDASMQEVKTELVKLQNQVGAGVELRIRSYADEAASGAVVKHERGPHHRRGTHQSDAYYQKRSGGGK